MLDKPVVEIVGSAAYQRRQRVSKAILWHRVIGERILLIAESAAIAVVEGVS